jgi:hypothetical protein
MNDATTAQLCASRVLPAYAHGALWVSCGSETVRAEGPTGLFTLRSPAESGQPVRVRWGGAEGPLIALLAWQPDQLDWDGAVALGGYADALHTGTLPGMKADDDALTTLFISGRPLRPGAARFPAAEQRARVPYTRPMLHTDAIDEDEADETVTTWLAWDGSSAMALAQDALVSKLPVLVFGRLAPAALGWHNAFALPLVLEGLTLLPG